MYSFGMLSSDTPTNDQNTVPFITPSPAVGEGLAPKAPLKKVCTYHRAFLAVQNKIKLSKTVLDKRIRLPVKY